MKYQRVKQSSLQYFSVIALCKLFTTMQQLFRVLLVQCHMMLERNPHREEGTRVPLIVPLLSSEADLSAICQKFSPGLRADN